MPSLSTYRRISSQSQMNLGQFYKDYSDTVMEKTWGNDIQSKVCYIYDYYHDDSPLKKDRITYGINTTKTKIDAKFIVTKYNSVNKDAVEFHIMFKPSQKVEFEQGDELFYFETDYRQKYYNDFPVGMYIDIPNEKGVYEKWLCVSKDDGNQFIKYSVLKCNYELMWIEQDGNKRIKRRMWSVLRNQNSYNSGLWTADRTTSVENQNKVYLPLNPISSKIYYTNLSDDKKNTRIIVSALIDYPITWQVSKVENVNPNGLQKLTLAQDYFNPHTDYVNFETGEMYADYYSTNSNPVYDFDPLPSPTTDVCTLSASTSYIKIGGSYKTIIASFLDSNGLDTTLEHVNLSWTCYVQKDNEWVDITNSDLITWLNTSNKNEIKIKFIKNRDYLGNSLKIVCSDNNSLSTGSIVFDLVI